LARERTAISANARRKSETRKDSNRKLTQSGLAEGRMFADIGGDPTGTIQRGENPEGDSKGRDGIEGSRRENEKRKNAISNAKSQNGQAQSGSGKKHRIKGEGVRTEGPPHTLTPVIRRLRGEGWKAQGRGISERQRVCGCATAGEKEGTVMRAW